MNVSKFLVEREPEPHVIEGEATVWIKPASPRRIEDVSDKFTTHKVRGGKVIARTNERAVQLKLLDETVVRWEKIEDEDGTMECNYANKVRLYDLWAAFRLAWQEAVFGEYAVEQKPETVDLEEALEGNS